MLTRLFKTLTSTCQASTCWRLAAAASRWPDRAGPGRYQRNSLVTLTTKDRLSSLEGKRPVSPPRPSL